MLGNPGNPNGWSSKPSADRCSLACCNAALAACALAAVVLAGRASGEESNQLRFGSDVRPVLSDKCYFCHGPDEENREADLRLDTPEGAKYAIESGELLRRVLSDDPDEQMPPPYAKVDLSADERRVIQGWIDQGAEYEGHWAFEPLPSDVDVPTSTEDSWSRSALDRFVWRDLSARGFSPADDASPLRWLRRVTLDLTGLPPTVDELDAFLAHLESAPSRETAFVTAAERLLASTAYGEHMAIAWLDAARYADSYGYQSDKLNTQWPFRDWVVKAFNENLPYDQFVTWQLAGDLLDEPTREQRLATAFNRLHRLNNEGGAVFEEWRLENVADRVHTYGTAVLGLTLECCRCHDHKYDPIPARDYYALSAFFNSIDENGVYDNSEKVPTPSLMLPTNEQAVALERAKRAMEAAETVYRRAVAAAERRFSTWTPTEDLSYGAADLVRSLGFDVPYEARFKDEVYYSGSGDANLAESLEAVQVSDSPLPRLARSHASDGAASSLPQERPTSRLAVRLDGERGLVMPGIAPIDRWTPFSIVITLRETSRAAAPAVVAQYSHGQLAFNGWDLIIADGFLESRMYRIWPGNAIGVRSENALAFDEWHQVTATYDGSSRAAGLKLYVDGERVETTVLRDRLQKQATVKVMHGGQLTIGQRFRDRGFKDGLIDDVRVYRRELTPAEIAHLSAGGEFSPTAAYYAGVVDTHARAALAELTAAREAYVMAEEAIHEIPMMEETDAPRETHVLARGAYDAETGPETRVERKTFSDIGPGFPADEPRDRLGLARWSTLPDHPLTARVFVNRVWSNFFGNGLVRTPENFGLQGELPTHPELLDWLARDFVTHGWDVKRLCRQIVLSSTYRQDSKPSSELAAADPENRLLGRGPSHRLSAEQIRDLALAASGRLDRRLGGPPVSPYQPGRDLWKESNSMSPAYEQSVGEDLYRRSLYSVWKRTAPLPNMMAFDTQSREVCTVKRPRTNTPLQALVLLNDPQFVEAARSLAEEALTRDPDEPLTLAFRTLTGRPPTPAEASELQRLFEAEAGYYGENPGAADALTRVGDSEPGGDSDTPRLAAMTVVCQAVMNLDATVWKR